jgi:hypothetical protein
MLRQLDSRKNDGVTVELVWDSDTNRIAILLFPDGSNEAVGIPVPNHLALDAFHHPMAYFPESVSDALFARR